MKTKTGLEDPGSLTADVYKITHGVAELLPNYNSQYCETTVACFSESFWLKQHGEHGLNT